jgi:hypothetical protein
MTGSCDKKWLKSLGTPGSTILIGIGQDEGRQPSTGKSGNIVAETARDQLTQEDIKHEERKEKKKRSARWEILSLCVGLASHYG